MDLPGGDSGLFMLAVAAAVFDESCRHRNSIVCKFFNSSIMLFLRLFGHEMMIKGFEQVFYSAAA